MKALEDRRCSPHSLCVQLILDPPHVPLPECRASPADLVQVRAGLRMMPGVEPRMCRRDTDHVDIRGKIVVHPHAQDIRLVTCLRFQVRHLVQGMNTCIRSPTACEFETLCTQCISERSEQLALYRTGVLLNLPTGVAGPFILKIQTESCHACKLGRAQTAIATLH